MFGAAGELTLGQRRSLQPADLFADGGEQNRDGGRGDEWRLL